jgi:hypothetical protein
MSRRTLLLVLAAIGLVAAACGTEASGASGGDGGTEVSIDEPSDGAELTTPFTVEVSASEEIGPEETGLHHVHLFFDGNDDEYQVVTSDSVEVDDLSPGDHTLGVSLRNADHSPAGAEAEISITVAEANEEGAGGSEDPDRTDDGFDY